MYIEFLLKRKKPSLASASETINPAPSERRKARFERRKQVERRKGHCQNYKGASRRVTIDRRESVSARRTGNSDILTSGSAA